MLKPPEAKIFEKRTLKTYPNGSQKDSYCVINLLFKPPEAKFFEKYTLKTYSSSMYHVPIVGYIIKWNVHVI